TNIYLYLSLYGCSRYICRRAACGSVWEKKCDHFFIVGCSPIGASTAICRTAPCDYFTCFIGSYRNVEFFSICCLCTRINAGYYLHGIRINSRSCVWNGRDWFCSTRINDRLGGTDSDYGNHFLVAFTRTTKLYAAYG